VSLKIAAISEFQCVMAKYKVMPHYMESNVRSIAMGKDEEPVDLNVFIDRVFVPKVTPFLEHRGYQIPATFRFQEEPQFFSPRVSEQKNVVGLTQKMALNQTATSSRKKLMFMKPPLCPNTQ
jgi:hypothetical protein